MAELCPKCSLRGKLLDITQQSAAMIWLKIWIWCKMAKQTAELYFTVPARGRWSCASCCCGRWWSALRQFESQMWQLKSQIRQLESQISKQRNNQWDLSLAEERGRWRWSRPEIQKVSAKSLDLRLKKNKFQQKVEKEPTLLLRLKNLIQRKKIPRG